MRRSWRVWLAAVLASLCVASVAVARSVTTESSRTTGAAVARLRVSPGTGSPRTRFTLRFDAPRASGVSGGDRVSYTVEASHGIGPSAGCVNNVSVRPDAFGPGTIEARITAAAGGPGLCAGRYSGEVLELVQPVCGPVLAAPGGADLISVPRPRQMCPMFIQARPLGSFSFRVR